MISRIIKYVTFQARRFAALKSLEIDKKAVIRDIIGEQEISGGYFLVLTIANLIALSGLIMSSSPVIIGAMLISPLMGPILSTGFFFLTGDKTIGLNSVRKIAVSVGATIIFAALATYFSPLKEVTPEIIARTRPNLYDLNIAFLAGLAGAAAICTKKNYMTIVPGVAIATAVIPPLSVTGFGIGIGNFQIMAGGFLLFFTNFVAIIIATFAVFYFYGFRPATDNGTYTRSMKKRLVFLAVLLSLISIPLIYTLHSSIVQVRLRKNIETVLKREFDREGRSRLSIFTYKEGKDGIIAILTTVNTTSYLKAGDIAIKEKKVRDALGRDIVLTVEQVKVQPGGLRDEPSKPAIEPAKPGILPAIVKPKEPADILRSARKDAVTTVEELSVKIEGIIAPSPVEDFSVSFSRSSPAVSIVLSVKRDTPLSAEQIEWLERMISAELGLPVELQVMSTPFVPVLYFDENDAALTEETKNSLLVLKDLYSRDPFLKVTVEVYPESNASRLQGARLSRQRGEGVLRFLVETCNLPADAITTDVRTAQRGGKPMAKLSVVFDEKKKGSRLQH